MARLKAQGTRRTHRAPRQIPSATGYYDRLRSMTEDTAVLKAVDRAEKAEEAKKADEVEKPTG